MMRTDAVSLRRWLGAAMIGALGVVMPLSLMASSHREAPAISEDPTVDDTDPYAFVSPERPDRVVLVGNWIPTEEPSGGPNYFRFSDAARYRINIDNDGQLPVDDIVYEFAFETRVTAPGATFLAATGPITALTDATYNLRQYFKITKTVNGVSQTFDRDAQGRELLSPPNNIGPFSTPNYAALAASAVYELSDGTRVFAGQRDDPFFLDLGAVFDGLQIRPVTGTLRNDNPARLGQPGGGKDALAGFNVHSIAIEVPIAQVIRPGQPIIGMYTSALRPSMTVLKPDGTTEHSTQFVQVSRLGFPLANELFNAIPNLKDAYNLAEPGESFDVNVLLPRLKNPEITKLFSALFPEALPATALPPQDNRIDLVAAVLLGIPGVNQIDGAKPADLLRLNTSLGMAKKPGETGYSALGVIAGDTTGFPNGRRPWDDIVDIELRVAAGVVYKALIAPTGTDYNVAPNNLLADGVDVNDKPFLNVFPFIAVPSEGKDTPHAGAVQGNLEVPTATAVPTSTATVKPTSTPFVPTPVVTPVDDGDSGCAIAAHPTPRSSGLLLLFAPLALLGWARRRG